MKKIAVVLSGCGVYDGSEIHESVLTLLAIEKQGATYQCLAPNIAQTKVVNHLTNEVIPGQTRNILEEAARIARGKILNIAHAKPQDYAAVIFPGGSGAALNLCNFAEQGANCHLQPDVLKFAQAMAKAGKPAGFICIAPTMISKIYGAGVQHTIGSDKQTAQAISQMGGIHIACPVTEFVVDETHKVVSTPAYMLAQSIQQTATGIEKLVQKVVAMT